MGDENDNLQYEQNYTISRFWETCPLGRVERGDGSKKTSLWDVVTWHKVKKEQEKISYQVTGRHAPWLKIRRPQNQWTWFGKGKEKGFRKLHSGGEGGVMVFHLEHRKLSTLHKPMCCLQVSHWSRQRSKHILQFYYTHITSRWANVWATNISTLKFLVLDIYFKHFINKHLNMFIF